MPSHDKQRVEITRDKLLQLREGVYRAYETRTGEKLKITAWVESPYFRELQKEMGKVVKVVPSASSLKSFFRRDDKLQFELFQVQAYEQYIASAQPHDHFAQFQRSASPDMKAGVENKLMKYYQKKAKEIIKNLDNFDIVHESFTDQDIAMLEKLQPLHDCIPSIHWDYIRHRLYANKDIVRGLKVITPIENVIVGFYILYPLTRQCRELLDAGTLTKSDQFELKHITPSFEIANGLYVSIVFGLDCYSRAVLLMRMLEELDTILRTNVQIERVYTRPVTEDGMRNTLKNGFQKLTKSDIFWVDSKHNSAQIHRN